MPQADRAPTRPRQPADAPARPRWPAEWEPHLATWLCWPKNPDTWPGVLGRVESVFARMVEALAPGELVRILVDDAASEEHVRKRLYGERVDPDRNVEYFRVPSDDAWVRDHGPIYVFDEASAEASADPWLIDFGFNAWGGKYPPWGRDLRVTRGIAELTAGRRRAIDQILEAGSIDGDGRGSVLTTESCLLNPNRTSDGRPRTRADAERILADALGSDHVIWLGDGIVGDDTDGHVDDITRFVSATTIVTAVEPDTSDANHEPLRANLERLRVARDRAGRAFEIVELPMPPPVHFEGTRLPASHANFYIANGVVLMPTFGQATDARAAAILGECFPGRDMVGIPSGELVVGLGAVHCLTQQQPASPGSRG